MAEDVCVRTCLHTLFGILWPLRCILTVTTLALQIMDELYWYVQATCFRRRLATATQRQLQRGIRNSASWLATNPTWGGLTTLSVLR
jgi:hypothetical protein